MVFRLAVRRLSRSRYRFRLGGYRKDEDADGDEHNADIVHEHQRSCKQHSREDCGGNRLDGREHIALDGPIIVTPTREMQ